jgi:hypothetical protein
VADTGKGLHKKLGPLEVWQYVAIGTSAGFMYYLYSQKKTAGEETAAGEKEGEYIGGDPLTGGGGGSNPGGAGSGPTAAEIAALVPVGPAGAPGAPGPPGEAGAAGAPSTTPETPGDTLNNPPTGKATTAPQKKTLPNIEEGTNKKGEKYTISRVTKNGVKYVVHTYRNGRKEFMKVAGKGKGSKAGDTHKPSRARKPPLKAPKPKPAPKRKAKRRG